MVQAYNMLDSETKSIIEEINSITYNPFYRPFGSVSAKYVDRNIDIPPGDTFPHPLVRTHPLTKEKILYLNICLLYTSDAADERSSVDLGGRRIIKKKNNKNNKHNSR